MYKTSITILLLAVVNLSFAYQEVVDTTSTEDKKHILDSLYVTGAKGFSQIFMQNSIILGRATIASQTEGLLIYEISVDENGKVAMRFMTKVSDEIESAVTSIIVNSANNWINIGQPYKLYKPLVFSLGTYQINQIMDSLNEFPSKFDLPIMRSSTHSVIRGTPVRTRTTIERKPGDTRSNEQIAREMGEQLRRERMMNQPKPRYPNVDGATMKEYNKELKKFEGYMKKGKSKKAYFSLNKIIRYNPFNRSYIQQRRRLEKELGKDEYRVYDILWLQAMEHIASVQNKKP